MRRFKWAMVITVTTSALYAGPQNVITLTDLKEAVYKLILDARSLHRSDAEMEKGFLKRIENLKGELENLKESDAEKFEKVEKEIAKLRMEFRIKEGDDELDRVIAGFVDKNRHLLPGGER